MKIYANQSFDQMLSHRQSDNPEFEYIQKGVSRRTSKSRRQRKDVICMEHFLPLDNLELIPDSPDEIRPQINLEHGG